MCGGFRPHESCAPDHRTLQEIAPRACARSHDVSAYYFSDESLIDFNDVSVAAERHKFAAAHSLT
jgi:hypothetical protein